MLVATGRPPREIDVAPPIVLHSSGLSCMAWETTQPPDEEALLGAAPGAGVDHRLVPGEIREIGPVIGVGEDREVAVVLVMAVGVRWEVHVAGMGDRRVDLGMGGVRCWGTGKVLRVARALA